jgi:hypothetical protein
MPRPAVRFILIPLLALLCFLPTAAFAQNEDISRAPAWYRGTKPWTSISPEGRREILRMRRGYEATRRQANEPSTAAPAAGAAAGKALLNRIVTQYGLHDFYRQPDMFGPRMVIWLPKSAWVKLTSAQRRSLESYMSSRYANWGIGVGRVQGRDVLADQLVVEH